MKIFAIHDNDVDKKNTIGYLFCYEKSHEYIIELSEKLDEWDAPLLFQKYVREKNYTILNHEAKLWINERVIPSGRQNIGAILKNAKLKEYNELTLLSLSKGKCSQDSCYLVEVSEDDIPDEIKKRESNTIKECFVTEEQRIVCMFKDKSVKKLSLQKLAHQYKELIPVLRNQDLLNSLKVGVGGYTITFNDDIRIPAKDISCMESEPITIVDFSNFVMRNVVDTTGACDMLVCSRQNVSYMVNVNKLSPIKNGTKEKLFTRGDIERVRNE